MADGVGARPHDIALDAHGVARYRVLAHSPRSIGWEASGAFSASLAGTCGSGTLLVEFLLMAQQQVATRKASRALWALEWLLFCMGPLVALQVL